MGACAVEGMRLVLSSRPRCAIGEASCGRLRPWMRHCHGCCRRMCARYWSALRLACRGHGSESVNEGRPFHLHVDRHGFLGVLGHRGDPYCGTAALLRVNRVGRLDVGANSKYRFGSVTMCGPSANGAWVSKGLVELT